ncbi:unnamed protein product [Rodentolepis nana]|uniref:MARVEL domain-containing protein n=1 Tax=Rodentolepis nana TaxID=102285 RepID=A0A0R3T4V8_RODNA|nr:unnamed protein product [Rodentolepis nana]
MAPINLIVSSLLLGSALCFLSISICLNHWRGGNLFNYDVVHHKHTALTCAALLITGLLLWTAAFIIGLVRFCSTEDLIGQRGLGLAYLVCLYLGTLITITGVLVYTGQIGKDWSYMLSVVAWTSSLVVSFMAAIMCRCRAVRQ